MPKQPHQQHKRQAPNMEGAWRAIHRRDFYVTMGKGLLSVSQILVAIFAGAGLWFTAIQNEQSAKVESARFALDFDEKVNKPKDIAIMDAAETAPPTKIFIDDGGHFSDDDVDELLGRFDSLYYLYEDNLLSKQLTYNLFCFDLEYLLSDAEIKNHVSQERKDQEANDLYSGFYKMASICEQWDASDKAKQLAQ